MYYKKGASTEHIVFITLYIPIKVLLLFKSEDMDVMYVVLSYKNEPKLFGSHCIGHKGCVSYDVFISTG